MELVVVDHVSPRHVHEIGELLRSEGLHPQYDDLPRPSLKGGSITTPVLVPAGEAEAASAILRAYYEVCEERVKRQLKGWWKPLLLPAWLAIGIGIGVATLSGDVIMGLTVACLTFVGIVWVKAKFAISD